MAEIPNETGGGAVGGVPAAGAGGTGSGVAGGGDGRGGGVAASLERQIAGGGGGGPGQPPAGVKRGRGRPPVHGRYSKAGPVGGGDDLAPGAAVADDDAGRGEIPGPADGSGVEPIPDDLREEITAELILLGQEAGGEHLRELALKAGLTKEEIERYGSLDLGERRRALIARLVPLVLREWGIDPDFSPTGCLLMLLGPPLARFGFTCRTLGRIAAERLELLKKTTSAANAS